MNSLPLKAFVELFVSLGVQEYKNLIAHSLQVAKISRHLAQSLGLAHHPDQVYLAGLLHDVGLIFKASIENYEVFIDAFRNIPDLEKIVLALDRKNKHSFLSHIVASHLDFLNVDCTRALLYHHTSFDEISDEEGVALLANCIKAADTISLAFLRNAEIFSEATLKSMIQSVEKDTGLNQEVREAAIDSLKDVRVLLDLLGSETHFKSDAELSCANFEKAAKLVAALLDLRSPYTRIHTFSVARIAKQLTSELMTEIDRRFMGIAALLHDLGKITTPLEILHKRGSLNEIETIVMRTHVVMTEKILSKSGLQSFCKVSTSHHERLDGSGYPYGIDKSQINMYMRILQISDVFSALTEERPYRKAMSPSEALKVVEEQVNLGKLDGTVFEKLKQSIENGFNLETFSHVLEDIFGPDLTSLVLREIND